jgi:hypothetical protein
MKKLTLALASVSVLGLSACVTQEQADEKMFTGCKAAVSAMIEPRTVKEFKGTPTAEDEKTMGSVYRRIKITYVENDDFAESERQGSCLFSQQWGMFKSTHASMLEQVVYNDQLIGKKDGNIEGDMNAFMKLNEKVDSAMSSN